MKTIGLQSELHQWLCRDWTGQSVSDAEGAVLGSRVSPRRQTNQDRLVFARLPAGCWLAALADGMGGMQSGTDCAALALARLVAEISSQQATAEPELMLRDAFERANERVFARYRGAGGTTLTALLHTPDGLWCGHVGDSRLYVLDEGVRQLTGDETALAGLSEERRAALTAMQRQALSARLSNDCGIRETITPAIKAVAGYTFLLTSDGFHDFADERIEAAREQKPQTAVETLVDAAADAGSYDDASVMWLSRNALQSAKSGANLAAGNIGVWDAYEYQEFEAA